MKSRWNYLNGFGAQADQLASELQVVPLVARLLLQRGLGEPEAASAFLHPSLDDLHDPYLMRDMDRVVERIRQARAKGERILIYGDYDVDGITSTVVLKRALEMLGHTVGFHIPARLTDGYGLQVEVIRRAAEEGWGLVISVDSGVRAFDACGAARELGLDLIVTDHHLPDERLPEAYAILNPKRDDCDYPDKNLSSVGGVFKLVQALFGRERRLKALPHFLKLVAIGTVADVVPLTGENRIIVKYGLQGLANPHNVGLQELLRGSGVSGEVGFFDVAFRIAPRINAVTRMGGGSEVVDLFSYQGREEARALVQEMNRKNDLRRQEEEGILQEIELRLEESPQDFDRTFLVLEGEDWHRGVIGIVASRVVERFHRPTLILSVGGGDCQGSGRSIPSFNLVDALDANPGFFLRHGGHAQAAGCTLGITSRQDPRLAELRETLDAYARDRLSQADLVPTLDISDQLTPESIHFGLLDEVERLAPWGPGNPIPVFASRRVPVVGGPWVLKDRHLKFQVQCNGHRLDAIWWKKAEIADTLTLGGSLDLAYVMTRESFQGEQSLLLTVKDIRE